MYHKSEKKSIKAAAGKIISAFLALISLAAGPLLYFLLLKSRVEAEELARLTEGAKAGAVLMYSLPHLWLVIILSLLCAVAVFAVASSIFRPAAAELSAPEENAEEQTPSIGEEIAESAPDSSLLTEYPELFRQEEDGDEPETTAPDIASFFEKEEEDGGEETSDEVAESDTDRAMREFMEEGEKEEETEDVYASVSEEIPEGYEIRSEQTEEEEDGDGEEPVVYYSRAPLFIVAAAILLISLGVAFAMSYNCNIVTEDGVIKNTLFYKKEYLFADATGYTVSSALSGDIKLALKTEDGAELDLTPASYVQLAPYGEKYADGFEYLIDLEAKLDSAGAKKTVRDRQSIVSFYETENGKLPENIEKIIEE